MGRAARRRRRLPVFLLVLGVSVPFSRRAGRPGPVFARVVRLTVLGRLVVTAKYGSATVGVGVFGHVAGAYLPCWLLVRLPGPAQVATAAGVGRGRVGGLRRAAAPRGAPPRLTAHRSGSALPDPPRGRRLSGTPHRAAREEDRMTDAGRPLSGRVALVTGASSGIGEATAVALAQAGAAVAIGARRADRLEALAGRLRDDGARVLTLDLDVTDETACRDAVNRTREGLGGLDVLVNNAGVMLLGTIVGADVEDWRRMLSTNVLGLMYLTHAAIDGMLEQGSGDVVNVSSVAGRTARKGAGVYNASKWAVNAFSESLRQEVTTRGVRVSLVEPGAVATELTDHITQPEAKAATQRMVGGMTPLQAADVARAIAYVVSQPPHVAVNEVLVRPTDQER
ncbi:SDR family NAD(P)-dependent oxidoreductase [Geodermatophilus sp. SYSU D00710]